MRPIDIDFVRRRRFPIAMCALLLAATVILADQINDWRRATVEYEQAQIRTDSLQRELDQQMRLEQERRKRMDPSVERRHAEEAKSLDALNYPWSDVLSMIEHPDVAGIALMSFQHDIETRQVRLVLEAVDVSALGKYVDQLNETSTDRLGFQWYIANYELQAQKTPATIKATVVTK